MVFGKHRCALVIMAHYQHPQWELDVGKLETRGFDHHGVRVLIKQDFPAVGKGYFCSNLYYQASTTTEKS